MEVDLSEARATFETNFFAVIVMCQTFLPLLIKAKGTIVQIGSVAGVSYIISFAFGDAFSLQTLLTRNVIIRLSRTSLALSTMPPRRPYTPSATACASNLLRLGTSDRPHC